MTRPVSRVAQVRVPGPLAPFEAVLREVLSAAGYTPLSAVTQLRLMVHLSRWLDGRGLSAVDLSDERVEQYLAERRAAGYTALTGRRAMQRVLQALTVSGVRPALARSNPCHRADNPVITVVVADDQPVIRQGFTVMLGTDPSITVVAEAADGQQLLTAVRRHRPDVAIVDVRMPRLDGLTAVELLADEGLLAGVSTLS